MGFALGRVRNKGVVVGIVGGIGDGFGFGIDVWIGVWWVVAFHSCDVVRVIWCIIVVIKRVIVIVIVIVIVVVVGVVGAGDIIVIVNSVVVVVRNDISEAIREGKSNVGCGSAGEGVYASDHVLRHRQRRPIVTIEHSTGAKAV